MSELFISFFLHFFFKFRVFEEGSILSYICLSFEYDQFYLFIEKIFIFILFNFMVYVYDWNDEILFMERKYEIFLSELQFY